jgi:tetratricopeptide (TPR) repeat protein
MRESGRRIYCALDWQNIVALLCVIILTAITSLPVSADYPIDVQRAAAEGDYYTAMLSYERMPKRLATTPAILSAAQSAWALSLPKIAIENYEKALRDPQLSDLERARIELTRGVIELQEGNPQVAILFAERASEKLKESSSLRSKIWLLWAEGLMRLGSVGAAEEKYKSAQAEAAPEDRGEIHFLLAQCQLNMGHQSDAIINFAKVPLNSQRTPDAMRSLALLSLETNDFAQASFWLETGRVKFPERFLDSWVDYALVTIAVRANDIPKVEELRKAAVAKYPPSDPWLTLLEAKVEGLLWNIRHPRGGLDVSKSK